MDICAFQQIYNLNTERPLGNFSEISPCTRLDTILYTEKGLLTFYLRTIQQRAQFSSGNGKKIYLHTAQKVH